MDAGADDDAGTLDAGMEDAGSSCPDGFTLEASGRCAAWVPVNALSENRDWMAVIPLADGRVLAVGGEELPESGPVVSSSAAGDIFDPTFGAWRATSSMSAERGDPIGVELATGSVLIVGGLRKESQAATLQVSAELFDPVSETWTSAATPAESHAVGTATTLLDDRVLLVGGYANDADVYGIGEASSTVEAYNPSTDDWQLLAPLPEARLGHAAALTPDGRVLVVGGNTVGRLNGPDLLATAFAYDPSLDQWSTLPPMVRGRWQPAIAMLSADEVLVVGGAPGGQPSTEVFAMDANAWRPGPQMSALRVGSGVVATRSSLMSFGGRTSGTDASFESEELRDGVWLPLHQLATGDVRSRRTHAVTIGEQTILVISTSPDPENYSALYQFTNPE